MLNGTLLHHNALVEVRGFDETDERSANNGKRGRIIGSPTPKPGGAEYAVMVEGKTPVRNDGRERARRVLLPGVHYEQAPDGRVREMPVGGVLLQRVPSWPLENPQGSVRGDGRPARALLKPPEIKLVRYTEQNR